MPRWLYYLLLMAIVAPIINLVWGEQQEMAIFIFSAIGLIPLAALIGRATEDKNFGGNQFRRLSSPNADCDRPTCQR